jgi:hypothetical protein
MGIDRAGDVPDANVETVEEKPDRPPPPPPDRPGTDGYPSRADSRAGAAAANETSPQATDKTQAQKPETPPPSRETSGEQASTVAENKPGTSAPSELNQGELSSKDDGIASERQDSGHTQADTAGRSEAEQASGEAADIGDSGGKEQAPDGWTTSQDSSTVEMGKTSTPTDAGERGRNEGIRETPSAENGEPVSADTSSGHGITVVTDRPSPGPEENVPVSQAPRDRFDVRREDDAGAAREGIRPGSDAPEATTPTGSAEDQPTIDKPQSDPPDVARPMDDASLGKKPNADKGSTSLEEKAEVGAAEETGATLAESTATPGQRLERHDAAVEGEDGSVRSTVAVREQDLGERLMVDGKPLRQRLDPVGAAAWSNEVGDEQPDPTDRTGNRIAKTENDERPRAEKLRSKFHREGTDAVETAGKAASRVKDVLSHPPTGHSETRTGPSLIAAPQDGISVGDTATALIAAGVMFGEFGRLIHGKLVSRKGNNDGRHR